MSNERRTECLKTLNRTENFTFRRSEFSWINQPHRRMEHILKEAYLRIAATHTQPSQAKPTITAMWWKCFEIEKPEVLRALCVCVLFFFLFYKNRKFSVSVKTYEMELNKTSKN